MQSAPYPQSMLDIKNDSDSYTILYWNSDTVLESISDSVPDSAPDSIPDSKETKYSK